MFETGLVSISFRDNSPEKIILEVSRAGLGGIEWGGDVHVPPQNIKKAQLVGKQTRDAGLKVMAYGSYYNLGCSSVGVNEFQAVLETAQALGAPVVRIWAGNKGSLETSAELRKSLQREALMIADMAENYGIDIVLECHNNTLTDHWKSALDFIRAVNHPRLKMYWQPNQHQNVEYNQLAAAELALYTMSIHVFHWDAEKRYPLEKGTDVWRTYLKPFILTGKNYGLLLEFMHDDKIESLYKTAKTLRSWIYNIGADSC